eukprot:scaffold48621_cov26-Prasinocladus_malaysianus.AAC.1
MILLYNCARRMVIPPNVLLCARGSLLLAGSGSMHAADHLSLKKSRNVLTATRRQYAAVCAGQRPVFRAIPRVGHRAC